MVGKDLESTVGPYRSIIKSLLDKLLFLLGDNLVSIAVYGSVARRQMRKYSDIDLIVIANSLPASILNG